MNKFEIKYKEEGAIYAEALKTAEKSCTRAKNMYNQVKNTIEARNWRDNIVAPYFDELLEAGGVEEEKCRVEQANGDDTAALVKFTDGYGKDRVVTVFKQTDEEDNIRICYMDHENNSIRFLPDEPAELADIILDDWSYIAGEDDEREMVQAAIPDIGEPDVEACGWRRFITLGRIFFETAMCVDGENLYVSFRADNLMQDGKCIEARPGTVRELFISTVPLTKFKQGKEYHCSRKQLQTIAWTILGVWNDNIEDSELTREWKRVD